MNTYDIKRLGLILSIQAEIEGAKLDNLERATSGIGFSMGWNYPPEWFNQIADELRSIVYKHDENL